jgi:hypothetical protein
MTSYFIFLLNEYSFSYTTRKLIQQTKEENLMGAKMEKDFIKGGAFLIRLFKNRNFKSQLESEPND